MRSFKSALGSRLLKDLGLNGFSMIARLTSGMALFVVMARFMGPERFGEFMYAMTVATIASLPATLGFAPQILREIGADPGAAHEILRRVTRAKLFLATLVVLAGVAFTIPALTHRLLFAILLLTSLCDSFTEYLLCVMRATGRFATEARLILISSIAHCAIVLLVLASTQEPVLLGLAFLANRAVLLMFVMRMSTRTIGPVSLSGRLSDVLTELRHSLAYSIDASLIVLTTQLDTVLVRTLLSTADVGIYQAGTRLVLGLQNFTGVAANVFIPKLAKAFTNDVGYRKSAATTTIVFTVAGAVFASILLIASDFLVRKVYGPEYLDLLALMPFLAALVFLRFCGSGFGVQLTAMGAQKWRTIVNACALTAMVALVLLLAPHFGLKGVITALIIVGLFVLGAYAVLVNRRMT